MGKIKDLFELETINKVVVSAQEDESEGLVYLTIGNVRITLPKEDWDGFVQIIRDKG